MKKIISMFLAVWVLSMGLLMVQAEENQTPAESSETVTGSGEEVQQDLTFENFNVDLSAALQARTEYLSAASAESVEDERQTAVNAAKKEWEVMEKYDTVTFADSESGKSNEEYLRSEYLTGLRLQANLSVDTAEESFWKLWDQGLQKRANVIEEMIHTYEKDTTGMEDHFLTLIEAVTGGYDVNYTAAAYQIQALLGDAVYLDGEPGRKTVIQLKYKQEELRLEVNGVVNGERVSELVEALIRNGKAEEIEQANQKLTEKFPEIMEDKKNGFSTIEELLIPTENEAGTEETNPEESITEESITEETNVKETSESEQQVQY